MSTLRIVLVVAVLGAVLCSPIVAAVAYTVTDLGPGYATAINNAGEVVGGYGDNGFLYSSGARTYLAGPASGINADGQIVGDGYLGQYAYSYANGIYKNLGTLGGQVSCATGVNASGQVVGYSYTNNFGPPHAFIYSSGVMIDLGTPYGDVSSYAYGINDNGLIVGLSYVRIGGKLYVGGFSYSNGSMSVRGGGQAVNDSGQVVGGDPNGQAFLYYNGNINDLGSGKAYGINNNGQVVGISGGDAFLYSNGVMTDLNSLIDPSSGWTLEQANAINDNGQIVGWGSYNGSSEEAFLLNPVPEPATIGLVAVGLVALVPRRRRIEK